MTIDRKLLLERIARTKELLFEETDARIAKEQREYDDALEYWHKNTAPLVLKKLEELRRKIEAGVAVTIKDTGKIFDQPGWGESLMFTDKRRPATVTPFTFKQPDWLIELEQLLTAVKDDTVTNTFLKDSGVLVHVRKLRG